MVSEKQEYQLAVDAFEIADAEYKALAEYVESGKFLVDLLERARGDPETAVEAWHSIWDQLKELKDERNVRLRVAKDSLRQAVVLGPTQERGPDGGATVIKCGEFFVSSVTSRAFDPQSLINHCKRIGLYDELLDLKYQDNDGREAPAVQQGWSVNYTAVINWLKAKNRKEVINSSYDEREKTPAVKGPKEVFFLGDKKGD